MIDRLLIRLQELLEEEDPLAEGLGYARGRIACTIAESSRRRPDGSIERRLVLKPEGPHDLPVRRLLEELRMERIPLSLQRVVVLEWAEATWIRAEGRTADDVVEQHLPV